MLNSVMQFFEDFLYFGALLLPTMLKIFRALSLAGKYYIIAIYCVLSSVCPTLLRI